MRQLWQKRGVGVYWQSVEKTGVNPLTQEATVTTRRRIHVDKELSVGPDYGELLSRMIDSATA